MSAITILTRKNRILLNSLQEIIEIEAWLLLTFFISLENQVLYKKFLYIPLSHIKKYSYIQYTINSI